jgi:hypothetical protein
MLRYAPRFSVVTFSSVIDVTAAQCDDLPHRRGRNGRRRRLYSDAHRCAQALPGAYRLRTD